MTGGGSPPDPADGRRPLPEYRFARGGAHEADPREYGPVRRFVRERPEQFAQVQAWLDAARADEHADEYLARSVRYGAAGTVGGFLLGIVGWALLGTTLGAVLPIVGVLLGAGVAGGGHALVPAALAFRRARRIRVGLPHAIVFLFALTHGGVNIYESVRRLADAEDTYGPVAATFRGVVEDTTWFDRDLFTALEAARERTPSDDLAVFLDELVSVLETGGDVGTFLREEARGNIEAAEKRQEELLNDLDTLAEVYIVFVFVGPVFLLVVLLVMSFVAPGVATAIAGLVYVVIPVAIVGFLGVFWWLTEPYREQLTAPGTSRRDAAEESPAPPDDQRLSAYESARDVAIEDRTLAGIAQALRDRPGRVLYLAVPLSVAVAVAVAVWLPAADPVRTTAAGVALPFLLSAVPYGALHELKRRHERTVRRRFPDALATVGEASDNEVPLGAAFELVAERTGGALAAELRRIHRDVTWTDDLRGALARFADRLGVPQVTRTVRLLEESVHATDDLGPIFRLVSDDLDRRNAVRRERRHQMQPYVVIVFLGVIVYLAIVAMFDTFFLPVIAERAAADHLQGSPLRLSPAKLSTYRRLLFHSALIQAVGNGLLLGKLLDDRLRSGVLYAAALVVLATVTFLLLA